MVRVLDLYCGMGGLSLGIALALEDSEVHGIDIDPKAVSTYNLNLNIFGCRAEVADLLSWEPSRDYDIVVGGPPCQPFSIANTIRVGEAHPLFPTFRRYFELVRAIRPSAFVLENVKGLLTRRFKPLLEEQLGSLAADYRIRHTILNAAHYGVPQRRERLIAVGVRRDLGIRPSVPEPTHAEADALTLTWRLNRWLSVREAIGDLLEVPPVIVHKGHSGGRKITMISDGPSSTVGTMSGGGRSRTTIYLLVSGSDTEKRVVEVQWTKYQDKHPPLNLDEPSRAVWSHVAKASRDLLIPLDWPALAILSDNYLRPEGHHDGLSQRVFRRLTVRECMRLQSFPDWWRFPEAVSVSRRYKLVGEAVPPVLAYRIAVSLGKALGLATREPPREEEWDLPYFRRAFADYFT
jgi:DNA (cytosine-5)-methyltransferase 1